ncbi:MAG TPA: prolyl oligopeptidase family serine peptidase [Tepidisphaeraceae bacterium]|nr:prolyl oligopeptidase family serine peptidase [Tepidisphaeraceae bacterium]
MTMTAVAAPPIKYPPTDKVDQVDDYHGVKVSDPYRWLEDDNAEKTKAWVIAQNAVTFDYLAKIPHRTAIRDRMLKLVNYERFGLPSKRGTRLFYTRNDGLQNQSVLYVLDNPAATPRVLLDPNSLSQDATVALAGTSYTDDGALMAYALSSAGSDWVEWRVRDVGTGKDLPDLIKWSKFSGATWSKDGKGFYYGRYDEPKTKEQLTGVNYFYKLYYHTLGRPQSDDALVYHRPDQKEWSFGPTVTDSGRYLVITIHHGTDPKTRVLYKDLAKPDNPIVELIMENDAAYEFIDHDGTTFWFKTDLDAPRGRVIAVDVTKPERKHWKELVPQSADPLEYVSVFGKTMIAPYLKDAKNVVRLFDTAGTPKGEIALPGIGSINGFGGKNDQTETYFSFTSYTVPNTIYKYDIVANKAEVFRQPKVDFDPAKYETRQVFYQSKDGTRIPLFITHKKGLTLDGNNPTLLYGYGGFNASMTPYFATSNVVWMELGGVYAVACIRGGGEYGEDWHQAGIKLKKQNVFDDFIAASQFLIDQKYTSPQKLAIEGGSNGGLLVGACMTQRPDLFAAAVPEVGVLDMLRFHKFTIGWGWTSDYGSSDNADEFKALYAYSPYHNLKPGTKYPATLVTTGDHDDRVVPAHSFKFAARLQECQAGEKPTLIRIETRAGHGAGKPLAKAIEERADIWAFLTRELGMTVADGFGK